MGQSTAGRVWCAAALRSAVEPVGMSEARTDELGAVHALAARLISPSVASEDCLRAIFERGGYGVYVTRREGEVSGFLAFIMLNSGGLSAVERDTFDPVDPDLAHVAFAHEVPAAVYCWGIATASLRSAKMLIDGSWAARSVMPQTVFFVRAATDAGRKLLTVRMPFVPYPGTTTGLLWWESFDRARRAA